MTDYCISEALFADNFQKHLRHIEPISLYYSIILRCIASLLPALI